jgi:hypothetical protein
MMNFWLWIRPWNAIIEILSPRGKGYFNILGGRREERE